MPVAIGVLGRIFWELIRYDVIFACRGLRGVSRIRSLKVSTSGTRCAETESTICEAFAAVAPFYWKPLACLQRSIVLARLMRSRGIPAEVVIGYRPAPLVSHAWVEVDGYIVGDSPTYQRNLYVLERL